MKKGWGTERGLWDTLRDTALDPLLKDENATGHTVETTDDIEIGTIIMASIEYNVPSVMAVLRFQQSISLFLGNTQSSIME